MPAIKSVIKNVLKKDHQQALKCILLNANTVQWGIEEVDNNVERALTSELQHCKFAVQLYSKDSYGLCEVSKLISKYHCRRVYTR